MEKAAYKVINIYNRIATEYVFKGSKSQCEAYIRENNISNALKIVKL
jgi:hypothetical protein